MIYQCYLRLLQGNKLTALSERQIASWTMLTELNACNDIQFFILRFLRIKRLWGHMLISFHFAAKNMLVDLPQNIGSLSRLIRLDLHQNSKSNPRR